MRPIRHNQVAVIRRCANQILDTLDTTPTPEVLAAIANHPDELHQAFCITLRHTNDTTAHAQLIRAGIA
jgi:hypothetical protein